MRTRRTSFERSCELALAGVLACACARAAAQPLTTDVTHDAAGRPDHIAEDSAANDELARTEFEKGRKAYDDGRYRDAWGYFHHSYKLSGRAELLYNIGQTADRLGMDEEALASFRMYLQQRPDADNRREVENRIHALEERVEKARGDGAQDGALLGADAVGEVHEESAGEPPPPPAGGQPRRQGWYFRAALGIGARRDGVTDPKNSAIDVTLSGAGAALELAVGATVMPGLALGGGLFSDWTSSPTQSDSAGGEQTLESANLNVLGPMIDWYLDSELQGWHVQGALGLARLHISRGSNAGAGAAVGNKGATGAALLLGGGYEWPVADDWAIGALGRVGIASVSENHYTHGVFAPSVLVSATWY